MVTNHSAAPVRDQASARRRIVDAAVAVASELGVASLGVNLLAKRAGVDKVLIYRYFGGLDGVLDEIASRLAPIAGGADSTAAGSYADALADRLSRYADNLRRDGLARGILAWRASARGGAPAARLALAQEKVARDWFARARVKAREATADPDPVAVNAVLIAAVQQLALYEASGGDFAGLDLRDKETRRRIDAALGRIARAVHAARSAEARGLD